MRGTIAPTGLRFPEFFQRRYTKNAATAFGPVHPSYGCFP